MKRENGYYWVLHKECTKFEIGFYDGAWHLIDEDAVFVESDFSKIDEQKITRQP